MESSSQLKILMVEDNELDRILIEREMRKADLQFQLVCILSRDEYIEQLEKFQPDIILCDFSLPQFNAIEALNILMEKSPHIPLIVVTGALTDETAVDCLKRGAVDYVLKERVAQLPSAIRKAVDLKRSKKEKMEIEIRLRQSEKQLRAITNILPALLAYISPDFIFKFCNKTYEDWFDLSQDQILGKPIRDVLGASIAAQIEEGVTDEHAEGTLSIENILSEKNVYRFVSIKVIPDIDEQLKGYVCLITDISDRKKYEDELKAAKYTADAANQAKTQFLANMSHEMRTPLSAIMGFAELLLVGTQSADEKLLWTEKIRRNSEHLKKLIDEILDLSKVESGRLQIDRRQLSIVDAIAEVQSMIYPLVKEKNLEIQFEVQGTIPEFIYSDPIKLRHILINIICNAIKFSERGPITVRFQMKNEDSHPLLAIVVMDKGEGIEADKAQSLFQPFTQVDSSMTRRYGGTGLGLALAKRFAKALGGDIELTESKKGEGSTFTITINPGNIKDIHRIDKIETAFVPNKSFFTQLTQDLKQKSSAAELDGLKVLLVEDAPDNQYLIQHFLEDVGAHVDLASDGQEGVEKAMGENYDLVLMDIQMPVLDGYHATSRLRLRGYKRPIVALTAHALKGERERCLRVGFDDFLTKPIKRVDLLRSVSKYKH